MFQWDFDAAQNSSSFTAECEDLSRTNLISRIWERDHRVWREDPAEIENRLGWLDIQDRMRAESAGLREWTQEIVSSGTRQAVVIGMGGSSLAPEVYAKLLAAEHLESGVEIHILDSTDPQQIAEMDELLDLKTTLFLVATKSGGTVETLSGYDYFHARCRQEFPDAHVGRHFAGITDPGSSLIDIGRRDGWLRIFENDPEIGGRFSALSYFGLVPFALLGADPEPFLAEAQAAADRARQPFSLNGAAQLGLFLAHAALHGCDKLTLLMTPSLLPMGDWLEQLLAESLGKDGRGVLPVLGEGPSDVQSFGRDRCCVVFVPGWDDGEPDSEMLELDALCREAGHPTARIPAPKPGQLGAAMFDWEFAVAVAGHCLNVHPFDQPDVEAAKTAARACLQIHEESGSLPAGAAVGPDSDTLREFLQQARTADYVALQAYLPPREEILRALDGLRRSISHSQGLAVTVGLGPRFLHSTGQMHKGGPNKGLFIQFIRDSQFDLDIPAAGDGKPLSFGTLQAAQALGDAEALRDSGRRVLRMQLGADPAADLSRLAEAVSPGLDPV